MFETIIGDHILQLNKKGEDYLQGDQKLELDIYQIDDRHWHVLYGDRSYRILLHEVDAVKHDVILSINGKKTKIHLRSRLARLLKELGLENALETKVESILAPMPGLIHSIIAQEGDTIKKGEPLLILEAMKMENVIKAPVDVVVEKIHVTEKAAVDKNALLMSFGSPA
jgi:biotin carboxyl carrier protein